MESHGIWRAQKNTNPEIVKESIDLAKVLQVPNQNMWTECYHIWQEQLDTDKDKVHCDQALGKNNKDAMYCLTAEVTCSRVNVIVILIYVIPVTKISFT